MHRKALLLPLAALSLLGLTCIRPLTSPEKQQGSDTTMTQIERGRTLVGSRGCNHCHSPKIFTPDGPVRDTTRLLSGHPTNSTLPEVPNAFFSPAGWGEVISSDFTAWAGPWGTAFASNLTPDTATGLGSWTEDMFIKTIRTGKHMGEGREILPPMPLRQYQKLTDEDLKAIFAYLKSLPPIENAVPDPILPVE